jgi:hypothetical protein
MPRVTVAAGNSRDSRPSRAAIRFVFSGFSSSAWQPAFNAAGA